MLAGWALGGPSQWPLPPLLWQSEEEDHLHRLQSERCPLDVCKADPISPSSNIMLDLRWGRVSNAEVGVQQNRGIKENKMFLEKEYNAIEEAQPGAFCAPPHPLSCVILEHHLPSRSYSTQVTRPCQHKGRLQDLLHSSLVRVILNPSPLDTPAPW